MNIIDRQELVNEIKLREELRKAIKVVRHRRTQRALQEANLRATLQRIILTERDAADAPQYSTGINELETLLKKIIPQLEDDYKIITTDPEQRKSFRAHIIHAVQNTLSTVLPDGTPPAGPEDSIEIAESLLKELLGEEIEVTVDDDEIEDAFIPVRDQDKEEEEEEEEEPDESEVEKFGIEGLNNTGRNIAFRSYKKIESSIADSYKLLDDSKDRKEFYDYLITNLKLYFDKFEDEMAGTLEEPTTPEYEQEKSDIEASEEIPPEEEEDFGDPDEDPLLEGLMQQESDEIRSSKFI